MTGLILTLLAAVFAFAAFAGLSLCERTMTNDPAHRDRRRGCRVSAGVAGAAMTALAILLIAGAIGPEFWRQHD